MEKLVKYILNFNPETASEEDRNKFVAQVSGYCMSILDDMGKFNTPHNSNINTASNKNDFGS